jgi:ribosomal protein S18 acetylase RimI-like enzyme
VLGYVQLTEPHDYIVRHFGPTVVPSSLAEVGKLFVATPAHGRGVGEQLLAQARRAAAADRRRPVLAVLPGSEAAVRLYRRAGLLDLGTFVGVHGVNLVLGDSAPTARDTRMR